MSACAHARQCVYVVQEKQLALIQAEVLLSQGLFSLAVCVSAQCGANAAPAAPMSPCAPLLHGLTLGCLFTLLPLFISQVDGLQCYACNIVQGQRYVDVGCSSPEVITCSHSHKGFKQRFCIRTESIALGIVLTNGCATSRHCHTEELPGVRIHCCDSDLCNSASSWHTSSLQSLYSLTVTLTFIWLLL